MNRYILTLTAFFIGSIVYAQEVKEKTTDTIHSKNPLTSISVKGYRKINTNKLNKQIFSADQFEAAKGGTGIDIIKNLPSISINAEGSISMRGSSGIQVILNGKPIQSDAASFLSQIPANSIERIEIMNAPSANYDADGRAGIINIITKKGIENSNSFYMNIQGGLPCINCYENKNSPQRFGTDAGISIRKEKWDITFAANYLRNDIAGKREGDASTIFNNRATYFPSIGERSYKRNSYSFRTNINYTIDAQHSFSIGLLQSEKTQFRTADLYYTNTKINPITNTSISNTNYFNQNLVNKYGSFFLGNLDYSHSFANKSILTSSILFEQALLNGYTNNLNQLTNNSKDSLEFIQNTGRSPLKAYRIKLDYVSNITNGKIEAGIQYRDQQQTGEYRGLQALIGTNQMITLPEFSDNTTISNKIVATYFQISQKKMEWEYNFGLRFENAQRNFKADKSNNSIPLIQNNLFPSLNILYQLKNNYKLKAAVTRRVQRNTNNELNPYLEREHSETLEQGDPYLLPELASVYEIGWIKEWDKGSFFHNFYYQDVKNVISRTNNVYNDSIIRRVYTNSGNAGLIGMETGLTAKIISWWQMYFGANLYHYSIKGSLFNNTIIVDNSNWVFSLNTNHTIKFSQSFNAQFNLNYLSERVTPQGKDSYFFQPNLSVKKSWSNKYLLTLQWQNIAFGNMRTNQQRITTSGKDFFTSTNYIQETNMIMINFGINLNQTNKKSKLPVSEFGEKEF